jgi:hypothetical protein
VQLDHTFFVKSMLPEKMSKMYKYRKNI